MNPTTIRRWSPRPSSRASWRRPSVLVGDVCQTAVSSPPVVKRPSQWNLLMSNLMVASPSACDTTSCWPIMPSVRPSRERLVEQIVAGLGATDARHVLRDDPGIARNVFRQQVGGEPGVDVVGAAGVVADDQVDLLALEELLGGLGLRRRGQPNSGERHQGDERHQPSGYHVTLRSGSRMLAPWRPSCWIAPAGSIALPRMQEIAPRRRPLQRRSP